MADDGLMNRFDEHDLRRFGARDAVLVTVAVSVLLVLFAGGAIRRAGEQMDPGVGRDLVMAVGKPAGWIADHLPFAGLADDATAWLSPDEELESADGFDATAAAAAPGATAAAPVTADAFDPAEIGAPAPQKRSLRTLLVTGDSLSTPLDNRIAERLSDEDVKVIREPHLGTGISKTFTVDWGKLSAQQVRRDRPDAVVVFIGANEGFPMKGPGGKDVECCGADWAAVYANRVRQIAQTYRADGGTVVYWIQLMAPRDPDRQRIARVVNAAIAAGVAPWRAQIRLIDAGATFTPGGRYRDAMGIDGDRTIVRESDGIHLNEAGAELLADDVLRRIEREFVYGRAP